MTVYQEKSLQSIDSANKLKSDSLYGSSVHCAYYSCVQLSKHVLVNVLSKTDEIERNRGSFHRFFIETIRQELSNKNRFRSLDFQKKIANLKALREQADYTDEHITSDRSKQAIEDALFVNNILNTTFIEV